MASAAKRAKMASGEGAMAAFLAWAEREGIWISPKVCVSREGTVADYGLLAREDLEADEVLFTVPRTVLLSQHTSPLAPLLQKEHASLNSPSGWVPLLLSLLHESTAPHSRWAPYLSLWPGFSSLDLPMFWSREEQKQLLQGTGVPEAVEKDLASIQEEFSSVVLPFMKAHPDLFNPKVHNLELYKRLVAFVMAYSFQELLDEEEEEEGKPSPLVMVPLADLLNHVANHNANLEFSPEHLQMVATRTIPKGQEVFNTYGKLSNWQLLHMYGFAEPYPGNTNDAADIPMLTLLQAALEGAKTEEERKLTLEQWAYLCGLEMVGEEGAFVIGWEGVLTEEELYVSLKVGADHVCGGVQGAEGVGGGALRGGGGLAAPQGGPPGPGAPLEAAPLQCCPPDPGGLRFRPEGGGGGAAAGPGLCPAQPLGAPRPPGALREEEDPAPAAAAAERVTQNNTMAAAPPFIPVGARLFCRCALGCFRVKGPFPAALQLLPTTLKVFPMEILQTHFFCEIFCFEVEQNAC
ncbi:N-lysine methyltransferase SETD6 isoform X1 [Anolis carolinensis]|uniref:N-lysine methyltransferase SETD6 isoform X1 n=1 Tax=Anolis carolinensis TaxID=28377 RepID=UPI002F2B6BB2